MNYKQNNLEHSFTNLKNIKAVIKNSFSVSVLIHLGMLCKMASVSVYH